MIGTADIAAYLIDRGVSDYISTDGEVPATPNRIVVLTLTGGTPPIRERTFDQATLQVMTRGLPEQGRGDAASKDVEALAAQVDDLLMGIVPPVVIGGKHVTSINYTGGPPSYLSRDQARRVLYGCTYMLQVERSVF